MYVVAINKTQKQNIINLILGNLCTHLLSMSHFLCRFIVMYAGDICIYVKKLLCHNNKTKTTFSGQKYE